MPCAVVVWVPLVHKLFFIANRVIVVVVLMPFVKKRIINKLCGQLNQLYHIMYSYV